MLPVIDSDIYVFAKLVKKGKTLLVATAEVLDDKKNIVAIGTATYMVKPKKSSHY